MVNRLLQRFAVLLLLFLIFTGYASATSKIDRKALVGRHRVVVDSFNILAPLSVGNGRFAFTVDFTGLQSYPEYYEKGIPLGTQSEWGWHSFPNTMGFKFEESLQYYNYYGRDVPFSVQISEPDRKREAVNYYRANPHRLHLGIIGLEILHPDGSLVLPEEISSIAQILDPWTGEIHSSFKIGDVPVDVTTYSHQSLDLVSSRIESPLLSKGLLRVRFAFPYPTGQSNDAGCDWKTPEKHISELSGKSNSATIKRMLDSTSYSVQLEWSGKGKIFEKEKHVFYLESGSGESEITISCLFTPGGDVIKLPDFNSTASNNRKAWKNFWMSGGAVDLSGCTDPRATELERRIVLSQYLTRIQCAGNFPPQETGLTYNSWYGKFHLEMHYWHGIHFALWGRTDILENSLEYYKSIKDKARGTALRQGFDGVRWPKMTDPDGNDSPSGVGSFLIWQQPHIIYMAELCYRNTANAQILHKYADIVFRTADFMASFAKFDKSDNRYILGPPLIPAQESFPAETTFNPPFELAYWQWCLTIAQEWRERLKMQHVAEWDSVIKLISPLPQKEGIYLSAESAPDSYTNARFMSDHPMVTGTYGMLPNSPMIDFNTMKKTFDYVWSHWHWEKVWGWDFPMTAMAATRLGLPDKAIDALFLDAQANTYLLNGHNYQNQRLSLYLPGNGALLTSIAMMCAGWDGAPDIYAPGFPNDGQWKVKFEGLKRLP